MAHSLWKFIDDRGTFTSDDAHRINTLYFPLCNASGIMSSVSPDLHGDIKTDFNSFLLEPVSRVLLNNLRSSRNFWVHIGPKKIWSAAGVSKEPNRLEDKFQMEAGLLWHKITRRNKKIGLKAEITSFVPAGKEPVEIMRVDITNISSRPVKFIPTAAIPLFARSAHNLHDHRHVTSLLQRVKTTKSGVIITPTLVFDETGHRKNLNSYFVCGFDEKYGPAQRVFPTQEGFTGEGFDLEAPEAVFKNLPPPGNVQGKEPM
ncbi:MAG: cellobiose phosphorylase, partial [Candidatus Omnitrophica bacterium]|nr:cellobiose phosphorylase [Candidatus Omnitrophota bacterium]